jgi:hypothetical protein
VKSLNESRGIRHPLELNAVIFCSSVHYRQQMEHLNRKGQVPRNPALTATTHEEHLLEARRSHQINLRGKIMFLGSAK